MLRSRITAWGLACAVALAAFAASVPAYAADEYTVVVNTTNVPAWITQYADIGAAGWAINSQCQPGWAHPHSEWRCKRWSTNKNGPWRLRMEVDAAGTRFDRITNYWYDGAQHNFNVPGDPTSRFFICRDAGGFYWSYSHDCKTHN